MDDYLIFGSYIKSYHINSSFAVSGNIECSCKNDKFILLHDGKQTFGIFRPYICGNKMTLIAECTKCKNRIILYKKSNHLRKLKYFSNKKGIIELSISFGINYLENKMLKDGRFSSDYEYLIINGESSFKKYNAIIEK